MARPTTDSLGRKIGKIKKRESPLTAYTRAEFQARYRLSKSVVKDVARVYKKDSMFRGSKRAGGLTHLDRLCLVLRYFATGSFYQVTGDTQKVSKGLVCRSVQDVVRFFYRHRHDYIRWPASFEEKMELALKFYRHKRKNAQGELVEQKTPFVFGLVDGTHTQIRTPSENESAFVCRKGYHSINTTIVADYDKKVLYCDPRWPGSVADAYALHASPVGDQLEDEAWGNFMLLGDSGYGLRKNLFTPYKNADTPRKIRFNRWHRRTRVRVEQTIGIIKQRWRIMDSTGGAMHHDPKICALIINACACLHNIARDHGIKITDDPEDPWEPRQARREQPDQRTQKEEADRIKKFRDDYTNAHFK